MTFGSLLLAVQKDRGVRGFWIEREEQSKTDQGNTMKEELNTVRYGRTLYRNEYLKSPEWKRLRLRILKYDKHKCFKCNCKARDVHHMDYSILGAHPVNVIRYLVSLCRKCHDKVELAKKLNLLPKVHTRDHIRLLDFNIIDRNYSKRFRKTIIDTVLYNKIVKIPPNRHALIMGILKVSYSKPIEIWAKEITMSQYDKILQVINYKQKSEQYKYQLHLYKEIRKEKKELSKAKKIKRDEKTLRRKRRKAEAALTQESQPSNQIPKKIIKTI